MAEHLTIEELKKLKDKLKYLETVKSREIAEQINEAASFGDLSENAAYTDARERQSFLQGEILELREKINGAKIVERKETNNVQIGSTVIVSSGKKESEFKIVSSSQADPFKGKISLESPVGMALLGKSVGDLVKIKVKDGREISYKIKKIK